MRNYFKGTYRRFAGLLLMLIAVVLLVVSCDKYIYDDKEPDWLGASIYDYLKTDGHYKNYTRLIEDLGYTEVLSKTGSKTLFVANDSAFTEFYKSNQWGVTSYEKLSPSQKKLILNFSMINNAYLIDMLSNYNNLGLKEGAAMRRETAISVLDSLPFNNGGILPASAYWDNYRVKGLYVLKDNTPWTMVCFTQKHLEQAQITNEDFQIITGLTRMNNDAHIFGVKIIKKDITCKNGYLNVLQSVMIPPVNMAEYILNNPETSMFSKLLERFSAPYYDAASTIQYRQLHPEFMDSIFVKKYFAKQGGMLRYPSGSLSIPTDLLLPFDPGWNSYIRSASGDRKSVV